MADKVLGGIGESALSGTGRDSRLSETKSAVLQSIETLLPVADHYREGRAHSGLMAQAASLNHLGERVALHQLPPEFVRSVINDARLDALMILADLKVSLTFRKQELQAPTPKLRAEGRERRLGISEGDDLTPELTPEQWLVRVVSDLQTLDTVESFLKNCMA